MNFVERITGMITKPDETTKDIAKEPRIEEGLMVVGVYMIFSILAAYFSFSRVRYTGSIQGIEASTLAMYMMLGGVIGAIITVLIGWPIITGVAHVLSMFFGADGKFYPNMLTLIGYTAIPLIIVTIISIALTLMMPVTVYDFSQGMQAAKATYGNPITILSTIVSLLGSIWTAYMMFYAVKNGEKLDAKGALIVVGLLFIANLLLTFGSVILALLM
ncbi:Yip1 domain-containing protein [Methanocella conradii HZ254]|uniref:Yip1 domain-containing protein n=1 Tax=Methanocella conradii (strain DSM 24694 / JCM 17849 / CGMCC 1.5162 / HZ254) TaxID=1041930 RepID=H8I5D4_METCZ|nr:Yip1 family protein [Methanocella conradii]AFC98828.1 Yip1 domain-containing protein [Methanocella conradii HZ254]